MDQQSKYIKADILDVPVQLSSDSAAGDQSERVKINESKLRTEMEKKQKLVGSNETNNMSEEEIKIRGELESDIERNLEEEIKDGIYHLALRLHRLYQHQKERKAGDGEALTNAKEKALSEVNIKIRMEGRTKIEIKEMKKGLQQGRQWSSRSSEYMKPIMPVSNNKKFDWATSLRSEILAPVVANGSKKNGRVRMDDNFAGTGSASGQRKGSVGVNKSAEFGWKW